MKDYFPFIKKAVQKYDSYEDIVATVAEDTGDTSDAAKSEIEDSVVNFKSLTKKDMQSMWATDQKEPDVKADIEDAFVKVAQGGDITAPPQEENLDTSVQDTDLITKLSNEFIEYNKAYRVTPGKKELSFAEVEKFLDSRKLRLYARPLFSKLKEYYDGFQTVDNSERITKQRSKSKAASVVEDLTNELKTSGEIEAAETIKGIL